MHFPAPRLWRAETHISLHRLRANLESAIRGRATKQTVTCAELGRALREKLALTRITGRKYAEEKLRAKSETLPLTYVASDDGSQTTHGFKFNSPVGRYVFLWVKEGVQGTGGYLSGKPYTATIKVQPYRQALTFLGKGALLSLSGDKKVGFLVRDVDEVRVEVGRMLPNELHHLAP